MQRLRSAGHVAVGEANRDFSQTHVGIVGDKVLQGRCGASSVEGEAHASTVGIPLVADSAERGGVGADVVAGTNNRNCLISQFPYQCNFRNTHAS